MSYVPNCGRLRLREGGLDALGGKFLPSLVQSLPGILICDRVLLPRIKEPQEGGIFRLLASLLAEDLQDSLVSLPVAPSYSGPRGCVLGFMPWRQRLHVLDKQVVIFLPLPESGPQAVEVEFHIMGEHFGNVIDRQPGRPCDVEGATSSQSRLELIL